MPKTSSLFLQMSCTSLYLISSVTPRLSPAFPTLICSFTASIDDVISVQSLGQTSRSPPTCVLASPCRVALPRLYIHFSFLFFPPREVCCFLLLPPQFNTFCSGSHSERRRTLLFPPAAVNISVSRFHFISHRTFSPVSYNLVINFSPAVSMCVWLSV